MEDWGINDADVEKIIAEMKPFDKSAIKEPTWAELEEVANSLL
jgi:hypothetical protein